MIDKWMSKVFSPSWKPSLFGIIAGCASFVLVSPNLFVNHPWVIELSKFITAGGIIGMGVTSKGTGVTGGTKLEDNAVPDAQLHKQAAQVNAVEGIGK